MKTAAMALGAVLSLSASVRADTAATTATADDAAAACKTSASYSKKEPDQIDYEIKNTGKRVVSTCKVEFYLYAKDGKQLGHQTLPVGFPRPGLKPGKSDGKTHYRFDDLPATIGGSEVASVETFISSAEFVDGARFEGNAPADRPRAAAKKK